MTMLEIRDLTKIYRSGTFGGELKPALRSVGFDIDKGEVVSLIGQSGSGKSTLGKVILCLTPASAGSVKFEGTEVESLGKAELRDYYRHVQGVFQDPFSSYNPLYKADRVFEMIRNVYFKDLGKDQWNAKIDAALESVSLNPADVLNKFPHQLSGGQQQRLLIARALLLEVKLLVADEIISMLDASTRVDVLNLLVELKRKGLGILFITHDLSLGNYISDRTVILREGAIVEMGGTQRVFGNPQHPYTKSLLSAVPQLHKKWNGHGVEARTVAAAAGLEPSAVAADSEARSEQLAAGESKRYSKGPLHPSGVPATHSYSRPGASGSRPSLMEGGGPAWHRRRFPGAPKMAAVTAAAR
ncbi:MAG TPA: ATP-binding cassette domain-containing protein, partial [Acidimicrobiales bacterium]|nr:ATP-binding cassette domain-containing protein [Acidimicrobiales bacterium]